MSGWDGAPVGPVTGEPARLAEVVTRLVRDQGVRPEQLAVLTAARRWLAALTGLRQPVGRMRRGSG